MLASISGCVTLQAINMVFEDRKAQFYDCIHGRRHESCLYRRPYGMLL